MLASLSISRHSLPMPLPAGEMRLLLWDDSKLEKYESSKAEGLCSVRNSKFKRLIRILLGFYNPPRPIRGGVWFPEIDQALTGLPPLFD